MKRIERLAAAESFFSTQTSDSSLHCPFETRPRYRAAELVAFFDNCRRLDAGKYLSGTQLERHSVA